MGGGPYDASVAKGLVFLALGLEVTARDLRDARDATEDPLLRDWLAVSLGFARDPSVTGDLRRILVEAKDGRLRERAAEALTLPYFRDPSLIPDFRAALSDPFVGVMLLNRDGPRPMRYYPVRYWAAMSLRALGEEIPEEAYQVPVQARSLAEFIAHMFDGVVPQSCLTAVQILGTLGEEGRPYLEAFVRDNATNKDLADSVKAAQATLVKVSPPTDLPPAAQAPAPPPPG